MSQEKREKSATFYASLEGPASGVKARYCRKSRRRKTRKKSIFVRRSIVNYESITKPRRDSRCKIYEFFKMNDDRENQFRGLRFPVNWEFSAPPRNLSTSFQLFTNQLPKNLIRIWASPSFLSSVSLIHFREFDNLVVFGFAEEKCRRPSGSSAWLSSETPDERNSNFGNFQRSHQKLL